MRHAHFPSSRRYLALWLPLFSTDRLHRTSRQAGHERDNRPLIVVARRGNRLILIATDALAQKKGLFPGLAFADARARVPDIRVIEHDDSADADLLDAIADWFDRYSPIVAIEPPDGLICDISGVAHLFGGEAPLIADIAHHLSGQGFAAHLAIAGTARAARALCRFGKRGIVPPGEEAQWVTGLPIDALECAPAILVALRRAGLMRIADLASRPRKPLAARFGTEVTDALAQILGEIDRPITPRRPLPLFAAEQRFAEPVGLREDMMRALGALAQKLAVELERHGQGGRYFEATFFRTDGRLTRIEVLSGQPLRDATTLARLFDLRLDALTDPLDPGFGFDMIRLSALAGDAVPDSQDTLDGRESTEQAVRDLIDRLNARLGPASVQRFIANDSHLPERAARTAPAISDMKGTGTWDRAASFPVPTRPLFLFHPPQRIEAIAEVPDSPPRRFKWRQAWFEVVRAEGPERIAAEWWRDTRDIQTRDYFRIEDGAGHRFWVFRYGLYGVDRVEWFIQGLFP